LAAFFLIILLVASASFFGVKVARAHRGEPWVASERFKNNLSLIGPFGVEAAIVKATPMSAGRGPRVRPGAGARVASRTPSRSPRSPGGLSNESLQFVLALLVAASAFTFVCSALGMLAWEVSLGTIAGTGLFVAFLLESREERPQPTVNVAPIREWRGVPEAEDEPGGIEVIEVIEDIEQIEAERSDAEGYG
jgi:hypothetical protein